MIRKLAARARDGVRRLGLDFVRYPHQGSVGWGLSRLLEDLGINVLLDVGAHYGEYGSMLRELGYRGYILSFEPVPDSFARLRDRASTDPKWKVHPHALGAVDGEAPLNVTASSDMSSFLEPDVAGIEGFEQWGRVTRTISVRVARLASVLDEYLDGLPDPAVFLKCDTQGFDWQVLEGAGDRLSDMRGLQLELAVRPLYHGMHDLAASLAAINQLGYSVFGLYAVAYDPTTRQVLEFDCLARR